MAEGIVGGSGGWMREGERRGQGKNVGLKQARTAVHAVPEGISFPIVD